MQKLRWKKQFAAINFPELLIDFLTSTTVFSKVVNFQESSKICVNIFQ